MKMASDIVEKVNDRHARLQKQRMERHTRLQRIAEGLNCYSFFKSDEPDARHRFIAKYIGITPRDGEMTVVFRTGDGAPRQLQTVTYFTARDLAALLHEVLNSEQG